jgi:peptidoglycan/LPS O-acetylase OafA/YrhL
MIQRKQSIWLLLSIISLVLSIYIPFGHHAHTAPTSTLVQTDAMTTIINFPMIILLSITIAAAGFGIFLFKNRGVQKLVCLLGALLSAGITVYEYIIASNKTENFTLSFGIALPIIALLFFVLAWSGIRADEKLLKSVDRLRD